LTQHQSDEKHNPVINKIGTKSFANFWTGMFFMTSSVSLIIVMLMFVFIWQPIWTEGFKDFHTISTAINNLNKTAKPASDAVPIMLVEMKKMNFQMQEMKNNMRNMSASLGNIEEMTPNIKRMTLSVEQMTMVLSTELPRITFMMDRVDNKMPNMDYMPFN
jgi:hypothetical protein